MLSKNKDDEIANTAKKADVLISSDQISLFLAIHPARYHRGKAKYMISRILKYISWLPCLNSQKNDSDEIHSFPNYKIKDRGEF